MPLHQFTPQPFLKTSFNMFTGAATTSQYTLLECQPISPQKWKPNHVELAPNCPRCASQNTKFCYYNNYSLSQPRYFCKGCRRYWTKGGSLRNVPVGGGCRKGRRRARSTTHGAGTNHSSPVGSSMHVESTNVSENSTNIDMAAVFAKYVNPNSVAKDSPSPRASFESTDYVQGSSLGSDGIRTEVICNSFEYQASLGRVGGAEDDQLEQLLPQLSIRGDFNYQDFLYQDSNANFDLHGILDQLGTGLNDANLPSFGSQPLMQEQFHDFGLFPPDDHPISNSWESFNLPSYQNF